MSSQMLDSDYDCRWFLSFSVKPKKKNHIKLNDIKAFKSKYHSSMKLKLNILFSFVLPTITFHISTFIEIFAHFYPFYSICQRFSRAKVKNDCYKCISLHPHTQFQFDVRAEKKKYQFEQIFPFFWKRPSITYFFIVSSFSRKIDCFHIRPRICYSHSNITSITNMNRKVIAIYSPFLWLIISLFDVQSSTNIIIAN